MGWRFRRSIRIAPGIRLNAGLRGWSMTVGPRGASVNVGNRGTYLNSSIPGVGLYSRERVGLGTRTPAPAPTPVGTRVGVASIAEDGSLTWTDADGSPLPPEWEALARKQQREHLFGFLTERAEERNAAIEALGSLHEHVPDPRQPPKYREAAFEEPEPPTPTPRKYSLLDRLFRSRRERVDAHNARARVDHHESLAQWNERKRAHASLQRGRRLLYEKLVLTDVNAMETVLEERLHAISWPRETVVAFEIADAGALVRADVDLPEIEDMPRETYVVAARELALKTKEISEKRIRELYLHHVHAVGLRVAGEIFAGLPKCDLLVISGFSQRPDKATGQIEDQYLYSARIQRAGWLRLNFDDPGNISPVDAFASFDTRREMSKTGVFKPIQPFGPDQP